MVRVFSRLVPAALVAALCAAALAGDLAVDRVIATAELHRTVDPGLVALLDDPVPAVAARAALAVGRTKRPEARALLRERLGISNATVRTFVTLGEGYLADPDAIEAVRRLATSDKSSAVRYAALDALDRIVTATPALGSRAAADEVVMAVRHDPDPAVRGHAAVTLTA